jgi:hypothetical protein
MNALRQRLGDVMVRLLSDPADRLRLTAFADVALALADALESTAAPVTLESVTDAVRRAFARLPRPEGDDPAYQIAHDIATADCDFVTRAARDHHSAGGPDLVLSGYGRWVREQLQLMLS